MMVKPDRHNPRFLTVTPIEGELGLRFYVSSESHPGQVHIVDLAGRSGWADCDCGSSSCRKGPAIKQAMLEGHTAVELGGRKRYSCKHVMAALDYWRRHALAAVIKAHGQ